MSPGCGEKYICKSKCEKTDGHGPLFEPPMSKTKHAAVAQSTCKLKCAKYRCFGAFFEVPDVEKLVSQEVKDSANQLVRQSGSLLSVNESVN